LQFHSRLLGGLIFSALLVCLAGCQQQITFPAPVLQSISPTEIQAGEPAFGLTAKGKGFTPSSAILWNNIPQVTTYDPATGELVAQIPATEIASPGQASITVETPQPGGGITAMLTFQINPNPSQVPDITALSPGSVTAGSGQVSLTVTGRDFVSQSTVIVNGSARPTGFSNSTSLEAILSADDVARAGTLQISVFNPPPDGGSSNTFIFDVNNPVPKLASLNPTALLAGSASTSLVLSGANYVPASTVLINGAPRTTAYTNATQVSATLTAGDLTSGGVVQVAVENPGPGGGTSNILTLAVNPSDAAGLPDLVDYGYDGSQANNGICGTISACSSGTLTFATVGPSVSTTGQYVAFASNSTNLLQNQANPASAIFVRDTCLSNTIVSGGGSTCIPKTVLADFGVNGSLPNGPAEEPSIDSSGAQVAYTSTATNLVGYSAADGTTRQVYWQPTCVLASSSTGCTPSGSTGTAALVSIGVDGVTPGNGDSYDPVISPDGQYVAFVSLATNLVSGIRVDGLTPQIYVRNTCSVVPPATGSCTPTTYLVSTPDGSTPGDHASSAPAISNDGLFVSFTSTAANLLSRPSSYTGTPEIFERSTCVTTIGTVGGACVPATTLVSSPDGVTRADGASSDSSVSQDGRFVAFASASTNLITGVCSALQGCVQQVYVNDTCTGVAVTTPPSCNPSLTLISTPDGVTPANALSESPSINRCITSTSVTIACGTGQFIAFASKATNLGPNVQNGVENIFTRNTCQGLSTTTTACTPYTFLASVPQGTQAPPANGDSIVPALSGDGLVVGFLSSASNLVANDNNAIPDAFIAGAAPTVNLTVALQGSGSGTVTDNQSRVQCVLTTGTQTGTCSANYIYGSTVTLTAAPASGYKFTGWGGSVTTTTCPADVDSCSVTLVIANSVTATFQ
jgi:Divergent InlB B-repeat domain/WD40-like Beta Propeller Repeat